MLGDTPKFLDSYDPVKELQDWQRAEPLTGEVPNSRDVTVRLMPFRVWVRLEWKRADGDPLRPRLWVLERTAVDPKEAVYAVLSEFAVRPEGK